MINTFIKKPHTLQSATNFRLDTENFDDDKVFAKPLDVAPVKTDRDEVDNQKKTNGGTSNSSKDR